MKVESLLVLELIDIELAGVVEILEPDDKFAMPTIGGRSTLWTRILRDE